MEFQAKFVTESTDSPHSRSDFNLKFLGTHFKPARIPAGKLGVKIDGNKQTEAKVFPTSTTSYRRSSWTEKLYGHIKRSEQTTLLSWTEQITLIINNFHIYVRLVSHYVRSIVVKR